MFSAPHEDIERSFDSSMIKLGPQLKNLVHLEIMYDWCCYHELVLNILQHPSPMLESIRFYWVHIYNADGTKEALKSTTSQSKLKKLVVSTSR
jgi:hypothetical protein